MIPSPSTEPVSAPARAFLARLAVAVLLIGTSAGAAAAQELDGRPINEIRFQGLESLAQDTLEFYLGIEVGRPYSAEELNGNLYALWQTRLVEDITVEAHAQDDGVRLEIEVVERPTLVSIEYVGLDKVSRSDVSERIAKDRIAVREGDPLDLGELRRLETVIEELYSEKGFRLADAEFTIETVAPGDERVTFTVDEGDKVRIEEIDFEGNTVFSDRRLRFAMKKTKETGLLWRILKRDIFKAPTFQEDLDNVRGLYKQEGYKNVVLGDPEVEVAPTRPQAPDPEDQKRRLFVTVPIEEGARWKLGEIQIEGNERFSDEVLLRQFKKPRGGWLRQKVIDEGVETLEELYSNTGHLFARVETEMVERDDQVADVLVTIDEGEQFRVGRIDFEGNTRTRDKVLRRELGIQEGMVLNSGALKNSILRIRQLEFFRVNEEDPVGFEFDNEEKTVDLLIRGEEGDRTELLFGGGFSEIDGFFGQASFRTRNFLGRGETLGVSAQLGGRQDVFDLSYSVPWFLDKPQSVGISAFARDLDYDLLTGQNLRQKATGLTLTYGRNLSLFRRVSIAFSRQELEDTRRQFNLEGELVEQQFDRSISIVQLSHVFDRRDSRLEPTVGYRYTGGIDFAGSFLGGETEYVRGQASYTLYKPLSKTGLRTVGAFNIRAGYIEPTGDTPLFFQDRFYTGGQNSVRGFNFRGIWVRNENDETIVDEFGFPLGGDSVLNVNLEYHLLVGGPFRILAFIDTGAVWDGRFGRDLSRLRTTAGAELRVNVPVFGAPLRFIFARNLDPLPDDRFDTFQFSIGPSF